MPSIITTQPTETIPARTTLFYLPPRGGCKLPSGEQDYPGVGAVIALPPDGSQWCLRSDIQDPDFEVGGEVLVSDWGVRRVTEEYAWIPQVVMDSLEETSWRWRCIASYAPTLREAEQEARAWLTAATAAVAARVAIREARLAAAHADHGDITPV